MCSASQEIRVTRFAQPTINPLACCICWAGSLGWAVFPPWNEGPNFGSYTVRRTPGRELSLTTDAETFRNTFCRVFRKGLTLSGLGLGARWCNSMNFSRKGISSQDTAASLHQQVFVHELFLGFLREKQIALGILSRYISSSLPVLLKVFTFISGSKNLLTK